MPRDSYSEEIPLQSTHPRHGGMDNTTNTMHPINIETPPRASPPPIVYREIKQSSHWFPWLIPCFIIANIIMFVITMYVNNCPKNSVSCIASSLGRFSFQPFKENPLLGPSATTLHMNLMSFFLVLVAASAFHRSLSNLSSVTVLDYLHLYFVELHWIISIIATFLVPLLHITWAQWLLKLGALDTDKIIHHHQGWRLVSCMWLHGGVFHLLANMLSLLVIGIRLEREFGFVKIGLVYLISGFGGSLMSALFIKSGISVGASGALFGLLGAMLSELITNWTIYTNKIASFLMLVIIIVINLGVGLLPHVDNFAHIGGFVSGFLLGFVVLIRPQFGWVSQKYLPPGYPLDSAKSKFMIYQYVLWIIALCLLIGWFTVGPIMLFRGVDVNEHCSWCHYLSCFPTSKWSCDAQSSYCLTDQTGNQLNVTCSGSGKFRIYFLSNITDSKLQELCSEVCN